MNKYRIRLLQLFFLIGSVAGILFYGFPYIVVSVLVYVFLEIFVGNATLHRYFGHNAFKMSAWKRTPLTWLSHHIGVGSVLGWVGHHRWHHLHSDTSEDLHSPTANGIKHILFGVWHANIPRRLIRDLLGQPDLLWWHKNYFRYHLFVILMLSALSPWMLCFIYAFPNLLCLCSGYVIAIVPHWTGEVKNSLFTEVLTFGEGWHRNHHERPGEYRFHRWDFTARSIDWFIKK